MKAWTLLLLALLAGCAQAPEPIDRPADWLADVRAAHRDADAVNAGGQLTHDAIARLQAALERPVPAAVSAADRRVVHQDLLFRIAELQLAAGQAQPARVAAERGLALGREIDVFTANLLIARGRALEAAGRDTEAAASYHEALEINRRLLRAALGTRDGETP